MCSSFSFELCKHLCTQILFKIEKILATQKNSFWPFLISLCIPFHEAITVLISITGFIFPILALHMKGIMWNVCFCVDFLHSVSEIYPRCCVYQ